MALTYFMARSAEVAYPRSQVSVYRTLGPMVMVVSCMDDNIIMIHHAMFVSCIMVHYFMVVSGMVDNRILVHHVCFLYG